MIRANYRMQSNSNVRADQRSGQALSHAEQKMSRQDRFILTALIHGAWGGGFYNHLRAKLSFSKILKMKSNNEKQLSNKKKDMEETFREKKYSEMIQDDS